MTQAAATSHRSLNGKVIARLARSLLSHAEQPTVDIDRARALRQSLGKIGRAKLAKIDIVKLIRADRDRR